MSNGTLVWNEARDRGLEKWQRGQLEHGGDLYRKPTLDEAIDEAIDLIPYLLIHRSHVRIAILHLKAIDLRTLPPAAERRLCELARGSDDARDEVGRAVRIVH